MLIAAHDAPTVCEDVTEEKASQLGFSWADERHHENDFTFVARPQIQYENRYSRPNGLVTESRFTLKRSVTLAKLEFEQFVSFDPIYDLTQKIFLAFREQIGISHKFNKSVSMDIAYLRQDVPGNGTRPGTLNGISTSLRVTVR